MGVAVYPRIENTDADWVHEIDGKALSKAMERLFKFIKKQGYKDLMSYYVPSQEDFDDWEIQKTAEMVWFNPMEGLALIEAMRTAFNEHREEFELRTIWKTTWTHSGKYWIEQPLKDCDGILECHTDIPVIAWLPGSHAQLRRSGIFIETPPPDLPQLLRSDISGAVEPVRQNLASGPRNGILQVCRFVPNVI